MNLATAGAVRRAREIGIRKAAGASRAQLVGQFLTEAFLVSVIAMAVALSLVELAVEPFGAFLGYDLNLWPEWGPMMAVAIVLLVALTGLLAGSYPAFYLASFGPVRALNGQVAPRHASASLRKVLVVFQFAASIALLIATVTVYRQVQFGRSIDLGFDREQIVYINPSGIGGEQWETLKRQWLSNRNVTHVTGSDSVPFMPNTNSTTVNVEGGASQGSSMKFLRVDFDFFKTYGIDVVAGREFSNQFGTDRSAAGGADGWRTDALMLNEAGARQLGFKPTEIVGKQLEVVPPKLRGIVVGVARDVYFQSLHTSIEPTVYWVSALPLTDASLRITGRNIRETLAHIDSTWSKVVPDLPVSSRFLDDDFDALYRAEQRQTTLLTFSSLLAILIACLGLFGLTSYSTQSRIREIGVRKAMGGTLWDIVAVFMKDLGRLILVANIVAWPVTYYLMERWLAGFAYRIDVGIVVFLASALVSLLVACGTAGIVAWQAARRPAADALRYE